MRIAGIVHQQVCQLKWHLLACLGLVMVLPIEDAIVNLTAGEDFFSTELVSFSAMFAPLLAGLIACANVQADLNEKRYIFWRSKPAGVKLLIALKFVVGLIAALAVLACPLVFGFVTTALWSRRSVDGLVDSDVRYFAPIFLLIVIMAYSLCFACNVILRNTARSWLIGMLIACFLLVLPFMLPLDYKDFVSDVIFGTPGFYPAIMLAASVFAFAFAMFAAQHDWHLKTSLKGMLWAGAALAFASMMLFTSQVANIKVLDEEQVGDSWRNTTLNYIGNRIVHENSRYVNTDNNHISFAEIEFGDPNTTQPLPIPSRSELNGCRLEIYPRFEDRLYHKTANGIYDYTINAYYRTTIVERPNKKPYENRDYKRISLSSRKFTGKSLYLLCELDISDCITDRKDRVIVMMRRIDNMIVVRVNNSLLVVDATNPAKLERIETKLDVLRKFRSYHVDNQKEFTIPLLPLESIAPEERVKLSIDMRYPYGPIHQSSIVDIHDGKIRFVLVYKEEIACYDVNRWDQENIYCSLSAARPCTILEGVTTGGITFFNRHFVENGNLYCYRNETLMVFDIRSNRRIRKLGHFVRMNYTFEDLAVFGDGRMLLSVINHRERSEDDEPKVYLYLLENPG